MLRRQILPAVLLLAVLTAVTGVAYPLVITGVAQVAMPGAADGSLVRVDGRVVGSTLLGQSFTSPTYFHPRPSAAGEAGYDAQASAGSNLGPNNPDLVAAVTERVAEYRSENGLADDVEVPVDAVTASGSGLDPHISIANAQLQVERVASARRIDVARVRRLVDEHVDGRALGVLGQPGVNVLELNLALDRIG